MTRSHVLVDPSTIDQSKNDPSTNDSVVGSPTPKKKKKKKNNERRPR